MSALLLARCVGDSPVTPTDGGSDATTDTGGGDAPSEAAGDSGGDSGIDAGPEPVGILDQTYVNGPVTTSPVAINSALALAVDSQGRAYVAGNAYQCVSGTSGYDDMVVRLTPAGAIDTTFGANGYRCVDVGTGSSDASLAVSLDPLGNVYVGGYSFGTGAGGASVVKLDSTGAVVWKWLYPYFDGGVPPVAETLRIVPAGSRVYALGTNSLNGAAKTAAFIVALQASNGALDTSFDNSGIVIDTTAFAYFDGAVGPSNTLYAAGGTAGANRKFYVRRFTSQGVYDGTFGTGGGAVATQTSTSGYDTAYQLALQSDGKLVGAGPSASKPTGGYAPITVARWTSDGSGLDSTFASGSGKPGVHFSTLLWLDGDTPQTSGFVLEPSGMMVVGGDLSLATDGGLPHDLALTHLKADGTLDTSFGQGGVARVNNSNAPYFLGLARDPSSGKYVVLAGDNTSYLVYRFE